MNLLCIKKSGVKQSVITYYPYYRFFNRNQKEVEE